MFLAISLSAYVAALGSALYGFFQGAHTARRWTVGLTLTGFLAHLCAVVQRGITARGFPVTNLSESLLFFGLVLMVVHLFLRLTLKQRGTTLFFLGFVAGLLTAAVLLQPPGGPETGGTIHPWIVLHITTSFLGYGAFFLTFVSSLMYLIADYQLKHRRVTRFYYYLPSLEQSDRLCHLALLTGFPLLTVGLLAGLGMASTVGLEVLSTHMVIFPLAAWTIFLVVLIMRHFLGARGRRWSYWNITAFLLALGVLLGISLQ